MITKASKDAYNTYKILLSKTYIFFGIRNCFMIKDKNYCFESNYIDNGDNSIQGEFYNLDKKYNVIKISQFKINNDGIVECPKELVLFYKKIIKSNK